MAFVVVLVVRVLSQGEPRDEVCVVVLHPHGVSRASQGLVIVGSVGIRVASWLYAYSSALLWVRARCSY